MFATNISQSELIVTLAGLSALAFAFSVCSFYPRRHRYPPGPPARPIIGNILDVSPQGAWIRLFEYQKKYGDLVFFHGLGKKILVLNSMKSISDLLEKKSSIYSDRPVFTVAGELMGMDQSTPLLPAQEEWRAHRKLAHSVLSPTAVKRYHLIQEDLAAILCQEIIAETGDFESHVRLAAARLILTMTYGLSVEKADSEYITHAEEALELVNRATVPGAFLCDLCPILKHLPSWMPLQREVKVGRAMIEKFVNKPYDHVKSEMAAGIAPPSLVQDLLSGSHPPSAELEHRIKWTTGSLYGAGGETTYAVVLTFIMAIALHPDKQRKAQAELDRVVGEDRLPHISDRDNLPYVNAVIKETMRWHPAVPLSIARCTSEDDVYEGYTIPKGTIVMPNIWAVAFAEDGLYDPHAFVPERFLHEGDNACLDPTAYAFGFARRLCPGRHLAQNSVFIFVATLLSTFDISPPNEGEIKMEFTKGLISYPEPFECNIVPRTPSKAAQVVYRASQCRI